MQSNRRRFLLLFLPLLCCGTSMIHAQVYPNSPVFRSYRPERESTGERNEGLRRQINIFLLERDAANGDPLAQHELGVRLLTGNGVAPDTVRSAEWMRRAASQSLAPAMYNYALLLHNGWGVEWDPFAAYRLFRAAAEQGMPEAQHVTGIFFTDDLVLRQNWDSAWTWVAKSAATGYAPAVRAKQEMLRRGLVRLSPDSTLAASPEDMSPTDAASEPAPPGGQDPAPAWTPVLLDFDRPQARSDTVSTATLLQEVLASRVFSGPDSVSLATLLDEHADSAAWRELLTMTAWGNPEATVLLGRFFAEGRHVAADSWRAAELYATAVFLESNRAPAMLLGLLGSGRLGERMAERAWGGDPRAQYVWACLKALDIETRLSGEQAFELLTRAAAHKHAPSLVQLGICHAGGRWTQRDPAQARQDWERAAALDNTEARLRLAAHLVLSGGGNDAEAGAPPDVPAAIALLEEGARQGALLAEVALAGSYERGVGRSVDIGEAVRRYRDAAVRGSMTAWKSLLRLHDGRRPVDPAFRVER